MPSDSDYVHRSASLKLFWLESTDSSRLLEEYGVSKKWIIIMDRRKDSKAAWTLAETSGLSAQARRNGVEMDQNRDKSSYCDICVTCDDVR